MDYLRGVVLYAFVIAFSVAGWSYRPHRIQTERQDAVAARGSPGQPAPLFEILSSPRDKVVLGLLIYFALGAP